MPTENDFHHQHAPRSEPRRERPDFGGATGVDVSKTGGDCSRKSTSRVGSSAGYPGSRGTNDKGDRE